MILMVSFTEYVWVKEFYASVIKIYWSCSVLRGARNKLVDVWSAIHRRCYDIKVTLT